VGLDLVEQQSGLGLDPGDDAGSGDEPQRRPSQGSTRYCISPTTCDVQCQRPRGVARACV
jgi:hypothetical protein